MTTLSLDFETYSECDLKNCGVYQYFAHPSTELLMLAWAIDDNPVQLWSIAEGHMCLWVLDMCLSVSDVEIRAFNATFERLALRRMGFDLPASRFRCTQAEAFGLSFSGSMDAVAEQFGLPINKNPEGKALIRRFSVPQAKNAKVQRWTHENDPEGWERFKAYCVQDVEVERALARKLQPYAPFKREWDNYALDQKINDRGVPVDPDLIRAALDVNRENRELLMSELQDLTGLTNPNSNTQMLRWLNAFGYDLPDMTKETIEALLPQTEGLVREVLSKKQQLAKTSVSKFQAFKRASGEDNRVRGMFQFAGASRTRRWAGRLVQLQNLPRGGSVTKAPEAAAEHVKILPYSGLKLLYGDCQGLLSDLIRPVITAPPWKELVVCDLSSIESRVLGWIADCQWINGVFASGLDTYKSFASSLFHKPYEEVTKKERNICKPPVLGCGFGLGWKGLIGYAEGMGVELTEEDSHSAVDLFRSECFEVVNFWDWCKTAVFYTTRTGNACKHPGRDLSTSAKGEFLMMNLPSGRSIAYHQPRIEMREAPWGDMIEAFTFMGKDRMTGKWGRQSASPGFLCENIVQALARDVLCEWMRRIDAIGFNLIGHVHDEVIVEAAENSNILPELIDLIKRPIDWAPGLILDAAGYTAKRYRKD